MQRARTFLPVSGGIVCNAEEAGRIGMVYTARCTTDIFSIPQSGWRRAVISGKLLMKPFSTLLDSPAPVIGTWSQFASPEVIDILGGSGFAFTIVDTEHGHFGLETAENLVLRADAKD